MNPAHARHHPFARFVSENIVPAVGAIVLAVVIRSFALQPFTIPTGSMEPTLHGDYARGDKILADKASLAFSEPERLSVIVFKFPEDVGKKRDFIKRVVGMPGETFEIHEGDAYINGEILRKPLKKQRGIWSEVASLHASQSPLPGEWTTQGDAALQKGALVLDGRQRPASFSYNTLVTDSVSSSLRDSANLVGDLMVKVRLAVSDNATGELQITLRDLQGKATPRRFSSPQVFWRQRGRSVLSASFKPEGITWSLQRNGSTLNSVRTPNWPPGQLHSVEFSSYDGTAHLMLDGNLLMSEQFDPSLAANELLAGLPPPLAVTAEDSSLTIRSVRLYRDLYWTNMGPWASDHQVLRIPEGHYIVLGDNSPSSEDSRRWGNSPFVPRENLVAQASVIFWPPQRWRILP